MYEEPGGPHRLAALDGLRGIAILLVVWYHLWLITWCGPNFMLFGHRFDFTPYAATGFLGVELFFFISGFVLFYPYAQTLFDGRRKPTVRQFAWRRFIKIMPSYALLIAVLVALGDAAGVGNGSDVVRQVGLHLIFLHTWFGDAYSSISGVLWSLGVEVQFYVLFPVLCWAAMRYPLVTFPLMFAEAIAYRLVFAQNDAVIGIRINQVFAVLDLFAAGMLAAYVNRAVAARFPMLTRQRVAWTALAIGALAALAWTVQNLYAGMSAPNASAGFDQHWRVLHRSELAALFFCVAIGSLYAFPLWQRLLGNPALLFLSTISYNLYLWHQVVADALAKHRIPPAATADPRDDPTYRIVAFAIEAVASVVLATVITYGFERPLLRLRPPWDARSKTP